MSSNGRDDPAPTTDEDSPNSVAENDEARSAHSKAHGLQAQDDASNLAITGAGRDGSEQRTLQVLEQLQADQQKVLRLLSSRFDASDDISTVALRLWQHPLGASADRNRARWVDGDFNLGVRFLKNLAPCSPCATPASRSQAKSDGLTKYTNILKARDIFLEWAAGRSATWDESWLTNSKAMRRKMASGEKWWPEVWRCSYSAGFGQLNRVAYVYPRNSGDAVADPFCYAFAMGEIQELPEFYPTDMDRGGVICGIIACAQPTHPHVLLSKVTLTQHPHVNSEISINAFYSTIDFDSIATTICLAFPPSYGSLQFIRDHVVPWQDISGQRRSGSGAVTLRLGSGDPAHGPHAVYRHCMRSFAVTDPEADKDDGQPRPAVNVDGLRCDRERVTFQDFYGQGRRTLREKRYSISVNMQPLKDPCGHFALVALVDLPMDHPLDGSWLSALSTEGSFQLRDGLWSQYNIYPAGLFCGISMFQLGLCSFIDSWEKDWDDTAASIDDMVSVKLDVLNDFDRLKQLVLTPSSDTSVLYFKVLLMLAFLSDSVRAAMPSLEALIKRSGEVHGHFGWYLRTHPHIADTKRILDHNWEMVRTRQREASSRILMKLERTTNEVNSLRDGLFNAQSVAEAQKSRVLGKYMFVFTIVTIFFLPPTFVATFFGMDAFNTGSAATTRYLFWTVLGLMSGITYLLATIGLFGSRIPSRERKEWQERATTRVKSWPVQNRPKAGIRASQHSV